MVSKALLVGVVALLIMAVLTAAPNQAQTFCSSFCKPSNCNTQGYTSGDCTACNTNLGWNKVGTDCTVTSTGFMFLDSSDDAGGMMTVTPAGNTANCPNLTNYLGSAPYGDFLCGSTVTVTLPGGTDIPHWGIDFIFDAILIDTDSSTSNKRWGGNQIMTVTINTSPTTSRTFNLNNTNPSSTYNNYCGDTGKKDTMYQFQNLVGSPFLHNATTTDIIFTITTDNPNSQATWVAKEFLIDIRTCSIACLSCNNTGTVNVCFSCDAGLGYMLNNYSCYNSCKPTYGYTEDPSMCIYCDLHCVTCYNVFDNCSKCQTSGIWKSYLYYNDNLGYDTCVTPCPSGIPAYYVNTTINTCMLCDAVCESCSKNSSYCYNCTAGYGWSNYYCYSPCPTVPAYFSSNGGLNCTKCNLTCSACTDTYICSACTLNGSNTAYLLGTTCYTNCPAGNFSDTNYGQGPNICVGCDGSCATCTGTPSPCQSCNTNYFLYNSTCISTCPTGYIQYTTTNTCLDCSLYCVDLTINPHFADSLCETLYVDMTFTKPLDFTTFDMTTFQTVSIASVASSDYTVTYTQLSTSSYRITLQPTGYIFLYNQTVTVTTKTQPATLDTSADLTPFKPAAYSKSGTISWFLLKSPSMSEMEKAVITNLGGINSITAAATTAPVVAEMKKAGLFNMLFTGAQVTATAVFVNSIPSQNMYEAVRFWSIFTLYDVPAWEQNSKIPNNVMGEETSSLTSDQRLLFDMTTTPWRYQRTGQSSFFLYDVYIPILFIGICWTLALIAYIWRRFQKLAFVKLEGKFFAVMHKLHEAVILYVTTAMILEWMYFDAGSGERWMSLLICLVFTLYFVGYELYIYYDMIKYPEAFIGNAKYQYYLNRYGSFLKNLRFEEYDMNEEWSPKHWFRPYNYHILSYYKKFCMIVSLPLFYELNHCQPAVLVMLQMLEMARFLATKPYYATWRNVYRFMLELTLLLFFFCVLINTYIIDKITANDPETLDFYVKVYYGVGWAGFVLVFAFNIGFLVQFFIDLAQGFRSTNRELMEKARRVYYYDKITAYEREKDQVPLGLMNRWVKLGNLNKRNHEELPDINIRIEYFKLVKHNEYFDVEVFKTVELFMNTDLNYHRENNTSVGKKIRRKLKLSRETSKAIFGLMCDVFAKHARKDTEAIVIKTFVRVIQCHFQPGDRIPLLPNEMFQKIELENHNGEKEHIKLKEKLKGFPLNPHDLESI